MSETLPTDLRPAQLGLVLAGRPLVAHVVATIVDRAARSPRELEPYEAHLVDAVRSDADLATDVERLDDVLAVFRRELVASAVHRGLVHRLHHDRRTDAGEQLLPSARALRTALRSQRPLVSPAALPWAVALGVVPVDAEVCGERTATLAAAALALPAWQHPAFEPGHHWQRQQPEKAMGVWTLSAGLSL